MEYADYFQSYHDYFWEYEENGEVISIPGGYTIAYRDFVIDIFKKLLPQGMPPFGSLLLAIIATNPNGRESIDAVYNIITRLTKTTDDFRLTGATEFLKLLSEVPVQFKEGHNRIMLFQAIFEGCHNTISIKDSAKIYETYCQQKKRNESVADKKAFNIYVYQKEFRTIQILNNRFQSVDDILSKMTALPAVQEEIILTEHIVEEPASEDLIEQLINHNETFHVGSLIKRIWSGLNIPVHSSLPSQQPLGGISDLTNKGDFDKLLISEFANDDIVFLSRLANNEALYIHREIPPAHNNLQRIILIDASLKNWGTPKTIAFAVMLAIAKHPKTDIECQSFVIGNSFTPVSIESVETIIQGLQVLEGTINSAKGLEAFFKENPVTKNKEIFFIAETSAIKQASMLKAIHEFEPFITYWIHPTADGKIDVFKKQQHGKKHVQSILLPLEELWKKPQKELKRRPRRESSNSSDFPILFRNSDNFKKSIFTSDGEVYQISHEKNLLKRHDKSAKPYEKGWELLLRNVPYSAGEVEIGTLSNGDKVLLIFNVHNREIILMNIHTGEQKRTFFPDWKSSARNAFVFYEDEFHHINHLNIWSINAVTAEITKSVKDIIPVYDARMSEVAKSQENFYAGTSILKKINLVFINESQNLVFNTHELLLTSSNHIMLVSQRMQNMLVKATAESPNEFVFADGSLIETNKEGMLMLKSSDPNLPVVYVPSVLDASLGVATESTFAGNKYYYKTPQYEVILQHAGSNVLNTVKLVKELTEMGLKDAKDLVDNAPSSIGNTFSKERANHIKIVLESNGAKADIYLADKPGAESLEQEKIETPRFFNDYIQHFISNIIANGTRHTTTPKK